MRRSLEIGIVLIVIAVAIIAGIVPYTYSAMQSKNNTVEGQQQGSQQKSLEDQIATQIASQKQTSNPIVTIQPESSKKGGVAEPFYPSILNIHTGDTVTWVNKDNVPHSVVTTLFNSGNISAASSGNGGQQQGASSTFKYTFNQNGIFSYFDKLNPWMGGTIYVDSQETQRELLSTTNSSLLNVKVEMPRNAAYQNKYGPYFIPSNALVETGDRLTWENQDFIAHTATSSDGTTFDTGSVLPGSSVSIIIPHQQGIVQYYCKIHPWMIGTVTISSPSGNK